MILFYNVSAWGKANGISICNGLFLDEYSALSEEEKKNYVQVDVGEKNDEAPCPTCPFSSVCPVPNKGCQLDEEKCSNCDRKLECPLCCGDCDTCDVRLECPDCFGECDSCPFEDKCDKEEQKKVSSEFIQSRIASETIDNIE